MLFLALIDACIADTCTVAFPKYCNQYVWLSTENYIAGAAKSRASYWKSHWKSLKSLKVPKSASPHAILVYQPCPRAIFPYFTHGSA